MAQVPNVPGVPALPGGNSFSAAVSLLFSDVIAAIGSLGEPVWGLFKDGVPAITADSVLSFGYKEDWRVSTYLQEDGAFESYNKVQTPFSVRLRFVTGGSIADKTDFLASIAAIIASTDLFDAVTPEQIYESVNPTHYDYHRTAENGVGLLTVDLWCEQIRVTANSQFSASSSEVGETKAPGGAKTVSGGTVQPTEAPASYAGRFGSN